MRFDQALDRHLSAVARRDLATLRETLPRAGRLMLILPNGRMTDTVEAFVAFHTTWFADPDWSQKVEVAAKHEAAGMAVATLKVAYSDKDAQGNPYAMALLLTLVFAQEDGRWVLVHDQNTQVR